MQSYLRCFVQKKHKEFENTCLLLLQMQKIKKKLFKNLLQHSKGCPERALSLQTILPLQSTIWSPGCRYALNQSASCCSTMHLRTLSDLCYTRHTVPIRALLVDEGFSKNKWWKNLPSVQGQLGPTFLCAYSLILTALMGPLSNQEFIN